jgi:hypothetical protein
MLLSPFHLVWILLLACVCSGGLDTMQSHIVDDRYLFCLSIVTRLYRCLFTAGHLQESIYSRPFTGVHLQQALYMSPFTAGPLQESIYSRPFTAGPLQQALYSRPFTGGPF